MAGLDASLDSMRDFRRHVRDISERLTSEETDQLGYILLLPQPHYKDKSALTVLASLEMQGYFSSTKPEGLVKVLKIVNRMDLVKMTQTYIKKTAPTRKKRKDRDSAVDESTGNAHFEVAFIQNLIMMSQLQRLKSVVHDVAARSKVEEAERSIVQAKMLLRAAKSLTGSGSATSDEEEIKSVGTSTPSGSLEDLYEDLSYIRVDEVASTIPRSHSLERQPFNSSVGTSGGTRQTVAVGGTSIKENTPAPRKKPMLPPSERNNRTVIRQKPLPGRPEVACRDSAGYHSDYTGGSEYSGTGTFSGGSGFNNPSSFLKIPLGQSVPPALYKRPVTSKGESSQYMSLHMTESATTEYCEIVETTEHVHDSTYESMNTLTEDSGTYMNLEEVNDTA